MNELTPELPVAFDSAIEDAVDVMANEIDNPILAEHFNPENIDIHKLVREAFGSPNKTTSEWARKMWYKLHNKSGDEKYAGDQKYFVGPNGNWIAVRQ